LNAAPSEHERIAEHKRRWNESACLRAQGLEVEEVAVGNICATAKAIWRVFRPRAGASTRA